MSYMAERQEALRLPSHPQVGHFYAGKAYAYSGLTALERIPGINHSDFVKLRPENPRVSPQIRTNQYIGIPPRRLNPAPLPSHPLYQF